MVLSNAGNTALVLVLASAAAALLWLVVEELPVEAYEPQQTPALASVFLLGVLALYARTRGTAVTAVRQPYP